MHKHQNRQTVDCVVSNRNLTTSLVHRVMDSLVSNISCVGFQEQNIIISLINIASASVSFLVSVFVAATILLFKKYVIFTQRLILYLCITAADLQYMLISAHWVGGMLPACSMNTLINLHTCGLVWLYSLSSCLLHGCYAVQRNLCLKFRLLRVYSSL